MDRNWRSWCDAVASPGRPGQTTPPQQLGRGEKHPLPEALREQGPADMPSSGLEPPDQDETWLLPGITQCGPAVPGQVLQVSHGHISLHRKGGACRQPRTPPLHAPPRTPSPPVHFQSALRHSRCLMQCECCVDVTLHYLGTLKEQGLPVFRAHRCVLVLSLGPTEP